MESGGLLHGGAVSEGHGEVHLRTARREPSQSQRQRSFHGGLLVLRGAAQQGWEVVLAPPQGPGQATVSKSRTSPSKGPQREARRMVISHGKPSKKAHGGTELGPGKWEPLFAYVLTSPSFSRLYLDIETSHRVVPGVAGRLCDGGAADVLFREVFLVVRRVLLHRPLDCLGGSCQWGRAELLLLRPRRYRRLPYLAGRGDPMLLGLRLLDSICQGANCQ